MRLSAASSFWIVAGLAAGHPCASGESCCGAHECALQLEGALHEEAQQCACLRTSLTTSATSKALMELHPIPP